MADKRVCCGPTHSFLASRAQTDVSRCSSSVVASGSPPPPRFGWRSVPWALDEETSERPSAAKRLCERCGGTVRDGLADLFPVVRCHCPSLATWSPAQSVCRERQPETIPPSRERSVKAATHSQKPRVLAAASPPAELSARGNVHRPPFGQFPG